MEVRPNFVNVLLILMLFCEVVSRGGICGMVDGAGDSEAGLWDR